MREMNFLKFPGSNNEYEIADKKARAALKKVKATTTILASGWTGDAAPYTNTMSISGITATNEVEVLPSYDWTTEQAEAWSGAMILNGSQEVDTLILKAYGDKPVIDITVVILIGDTVEEVV